VTLLASAASSDPPGWEVVSTIAAVAAAVAALVTVIYARRTVIDGRKAHKDLMNEQANARDQFAAAHQEQIAEQTRAREQAAAAHQEEMADRQRALTADISLQRLVQAGRLTDVLIAVARAAPQETLEPPGPAAGSLRSTFIPA
jgi:hypothetical protein